MNKVAILTGDIVDSTKLSPPNRGELANILKDTLGMITRPDKHEIYRGDSFQAQVDNAALALRKSVQIRCRLRQAFVQEKKPVIDARISVGIGSVTHQAGKVSESDGEAYRLSGRMLDTMKASRLQMKTGDEEFNKWVAPICLLLDVIINSWSAQQSEVVYALLNGAKQQEIAKAIGITQAAVNKRLRTANAYAVEETLVFLENEIKKIL